MDEPPIVPPKRFAPRAGIQRKTKAEREQYAREEENRQKQRLAEAGRSGSSSTTTIIGDGRSRGRGRGGSAAVLNAADRIRTEGGGGVFGASMSGGGLSRFKGAKGEGTSEVVADLGGLEEKNTSALGDDGDGGGEKKTTTRRKGAATSAGTKNDQPLYVQSDDEVDEDATRDIERIWISSDDEKDEQGPIVRKGKQRAGQLMPGALGLRPIRAPRKMREDEGGKTTGDGDEMDVDEQFMKDPPSSPELKKGTRKRATKVKESRVPTETIAERAERLRFTEDVRKLREEFIGIPSGKTDSADTYPPDAKELAKVADDNRDGRLYLFQLPPLTPFLVDSKGQYEVNEALEDLQATSVDAPSKTKSKDPGSEVKKEESGEDSKANIKTEVPGALTARSMRLPSGLVGKLNVHRSGKVSLDWGGTDLEVRYGNEVDFLQDAVLVGGAGSQSSWALGQVQKKLVIIPDWQKLYD